MMVEFDNYGGPWTYRKLQALRAYLNAYLTALQNQSFSLWYIDAFAGPGIWKQRNSTHNKQIFNEKEHSEYKEGSPLIALEAKSKGDVRRTFDQFYFIDNNKSYIDDLKQRVDEKYDEETDKVTFITEDANVAVQKLCDTVDWKSSRAVIFLDPFGMEVKWETIEAIAKTKAMDAWVLFPLGMAVNRMLTRDGKISQPWTEKLDDLFGTEDWYERFYKPESKSQTSLFGEETISGVQKSASFEQIVDCFIERLKTIFADVAKKPIMLKNSTGNPLFALCFAVGNPNGAKPAIKIAKHIIERA